MKYFDCFYLTFHCLLAKLSDRKVQKKISEDVEVFLKGYHILPPSSCFSHGLINYKYLRIVLRKCPEYRNVFYARISYLTKKYHLGRILKLILKPYPFLSMGTSPDKIGGGLYIEHGNSTIIHAASIGDYCFVNQNVTIGDNGRGIPTIGNHVKIHTGAVVLGPVTIGDYTVIGANATVVKDIPSHCVVVPAASYIMKHDGVRVNEKL